MRFTPLCIAYLTLAGNLFAQASRCPLLIIDDVVQQPTIGPGESFGVTAYQCASCGINKDSARTEFSFFSEPVVLEVTAWTPLRVGDVIEAVNGHPITTRAGADHFTHPPGGENVIKLRRAGASTDVRFAPRQSCEREFSLNPSTIDRVEVLRGYVAVARYGAAGLQGVVIISRKRDSSVREPLVPQVIRPTSSSLGSADHGRYGFALACVPSCTRTKASDGTDYWKFDGPPPVAGIMPGQPAAMAGLRIDDVVVEIDGIPITSEAGALRFQRSERRESIQVTIERDGKRASYVLRAPR